MSSTNAPFGLRPAFHPSGYYIAAGFIDKLRIFHVMTN
jgi:hypothetical protein